MKKNILTLLSLTFITSAQASVTVTFEQVGNDVQVAYSGSIDMETFAIPPGSDSDETPRLVFSPAEFGLFNGLSSKFDVQNALVVSGMGNPLAVLAPFDSDTSSYSITVASGSQTFAVDDNDVFLPQGYASGDPLSGSVLINEAELSDFGAENFDNHLLWYNQSGTIFNRVTITTIPEPASFLLLGLAALGLMRRRR